MKQEPIEEMKQTRSKCCNADFNCVGGGYDGEDIVPIKDICKKCGNECELIRGTKLMPEEKPIGSFEKDVEKIGGVINPDGTISTKEEKPIELEGIFKDYDSKFIIDTTCDGEKEVQACMSKDKEGMCDFVRDRDIKAFIQSTYHKGKDDAYAEMKREMDKSTQGFSYKEINNTLNSQNPVEGLIRGTTFGQEIFRDGKWNKY